MNLQSYLTWLKAHERLLVISFALLFAVHFTGKAYDYLLKHEQAQVDIAKNAAQVAAQRATDDRQSNQQAFAQLAQLQNSFNNLSLQVAASMQQRATRAVTDKKASDNADANELASILGQRVGVGTIKVETQASPLPDTLTFSLDAAHKVADDESDLTQAKGDVTDLNTKLVACQGVTDKQTDTINGLKKTVADDSTALTTEQKAHVDEVKLWKDKERGAYGKGAKVGGIIAVIAVEVARIFLTHKP